MVVWLLGVVEAAMDALGYLGLAFFMALESMVAPVPSEAVMPLAGFLVQSGKMTWTGAIAASSVGTLLGSLVGYAMGRYGGYPFVLRWGKYLLLNKGHLDLTARWFNRRGGATVFVCRFIPVVRHFISIPAGVARMPLGRFAAFTLVGGTIWNSILLVAGYFLKDRWKTIVHYSHLIDYVFVAAVVVFVVFWARKQLRRRVGTA